MDSSTMVRMLQSVLAWLKDQPFANVMALLQLSLLGMVAWIALFYVIPSERSAIMESNERNIIEQGKHIERVSSSFEKALDRFARPTASYNDK